MQSEEATWSEEELTAARTIMDDAAEMAQDLLSESGLHIWRGDYQLGDKTWRRRPLPKDTIIISEKQIDWAEKSDNEDPLLLIQREGMGVNFRAKIGVDEFSSKMPFVGGWWPHDEVKKNLLKLAHLELSIMGSRMAKYAEYRTRDLDGGLMAETEICESAGQTFFRCDILATTASEDRFCFAFLVNEQGKAGTWTREHFGMARKFDEIDFIHSVDTPADMAWIDDFLLSDLAIDEITRP